MVIVYTLGTLAAIAIGWLAAALNESGHAPFILMPLAVGAALGAIIGLIAASERVRSTRTLVLAAALLALVAVIAEHAWLYRDFSQQWREERARSPQVAMFRPETPLSPREYLLRELIAGSAALWCMDAILVVGAAAGTGVIVHRLSAAEVGVAADTKCTEN